jgi:hypothetical protein
MMGVAFFVVGVAPLHQISGVDVTLAASRSS